MFSYLKNTYNSLWTAPAAATQPQSPVAQPAPTVPSQPNAIASNSTPNGISSTSSTPGGSSSKSKKVRQESTPSRRSGREHKIVAPQLEIKTLNGISSSYEHKRAKSNIKHKRKLSVLATGAGSGIEESYQSVGFGREEGFDNEEMGFKKQRMSSSQFEGPNHGFGAGEVNGNANEAGQYNPNYNNAIASGSGSGSGSASKPTRKRTYDPTPSMTPEPDLSASRVTKSGRISRRHNPDPAALALTNPDTPVKRPRIKVADRSFKALMIIGGTRDGEIISGGPPPPPPVVEPPREPTPQPVIVATSLFRKKSRKSESVSPSPELEANEEEEEEDEQPIASGSNVGTPSSKAKGKKPMSPSKTPSKRGGFQASPWSLPLLQFVLQHEHLLQIKDYDTLSQILTTEAERRNDPNFIRSSMACRQRILKGGGIEGIKQLVESRGQVRHKYSPQKKD